MLCGKCNRGWHTFSRTPLFLGIYKFLICPKCTPADWTGEVPQALPMPESMAPVTHSILKKGKQSAGGTPSRVEPIKEPATPTCRSGRTSVDEVLHRRCLEYNNQQVVQLSTVPGEPTTLWGKIHYLGKSHLPKACQVTFTNGAVQNFTADEVSELICDNDADVFDDVNGPFKVKRRIAFAGMVQIYDLRSLPPVWRIDSKESLGEALRKLMPLGHFRDTEVIKMRVSMLGSHTYNKSIRPWGARGPCKLIIDQLGRVVRLANILRWIGGGSILNDSQR
jgi:hypothetical protein